MCFGVEAFYVVTWYVSVISKKQKINNPKQNKQTKKKTKKTKQKKKLC
jgi:hypothetical protein